MSEAINKSTADFLKHLSVILLIFKKEDNNLNIQKREHSQTQTQSCLGYILRQIHTSSILQTKYNTFQKTTIIRIEERLKGKNNKNIYIHVLTYTGFRIHSVFGGG